MTRYKDRKPNAPELICRLCQQRLKCCSLRSFMRSQSGKLRYSSSSRARRKAQNATRQSALQAVPPAATAVEAPGPAELPRIDEHPDVFGQFQSLQVVVPAENRLVCLTDSESLAAEKFRFLGIRLQHLRRDRPLKKVLITSTIPQEGKSMVVCQPGLYPRSKNTAENIAGGGGRAATVLIADVRVENDSGPL